MGLWSDAQLEVKVQEAMKVLQPSWADKVEIDLGHGFADANLEFGMSDIDRNSFLVPLTFLFWDLSHLLASPHAIVHHWIFSGLFGPLRF